MVVDDEASSRPPGEQDVVYRHLPDFDAEAAALYAALPAVPEDVAETDAAEHEYAENLAGAFSAPSTFQPFRAPRQARADPYQGEGEKKEEPPCSPGFCVGASAPTPP